MHLQVVDLVVVRVVLHAEEIILLVLARMPMPKHPLSHLFLLVLVLRVVVVAVPVA